MAENNLDGIGRRLRAPGSQHANAEELLVELVRLVESSRLAPERSPARVETVSLHPLVEAPSNKPRVTRVVDVEPPRAPESDHSYGPTVSLAPHRTEIATPTPSATDSGVAAHASDAPLPPVRPAPKAAIKGGGVAQRSTPNSIYPPTSSQSAAHVVVAKAGATGLGASEAPSEPLRGTFAPSPHDGRRRLVKPPAQQARPDIARRSARLGG